MAAFCRPRPQRKKRNKKINEVNSFLFWTARWWRTWHANNSYGGEPQRYSGCLLKQIMQHRECRFNSLTHTSVAKCDNRNKRHSVEWGKASPPSEAIRLRSFYCTERKKNPPSIQLELCCASWLIKYQMTSKCWRHQLLVLQSAGA